MSRYAKRARSRPQSSGLSETRTVLWDGRGGLVLTRPNHHVLLWTLAMHEPELTDMPDPISYRRIRGSCHCGNIRVTFDQPDSGPAIPVRACGCGLCTKHRAVWTSHPDGQFYLRIADDSRVRRYRFGTKTADFHVCLTCGVIPIVTCVIEGIRYAVFNVNTFDDVDRSQLVETAANFEGETTENRLARRRRNWTPEAVRSEGEDWAASCR
jgi:hypothetical protein